jgi:hypothetical protein
VAIRFHLRPREILEWGQPMDVATVAKQPLPTPKTDDGDRVTTWKCYKRTAAILRKLSAYLDMNQEDTLEQFARDFDNALARLQAKDLEDRKRRGD